MKNIFFILGIIFAGLVSGQTSNRKIDSLISLLPGSADTTRIKIIDLIRSNYQKIDLKQSKKWAYEGYHLSKKIGRKHTEGYFLLKISEACNYMNNLDSSELLSNQAIEVFKAIGEEENIASCYNILGSVSNKRGDLRSAMKYYGYATPILEKKKNKRSLATNYNDIGNGYRELGDYVKALQFFRKGLECSREAGYKQAVAYTLANMANCYQLMQNFDRSLSNYKEAADILLQIGDKRGYAYTLFSVYNVYDSKKNYDTAITGFKRVNALMEEVGDDAGRNGCIYSIGTILAKIGKQDEALVYLLRSLTLTEELQQQLELSECLNSIGIVYMNKKEPSKALEYFKKSLVAVEGTGALNSIKYCYERLSECYEDLGDFKNAIKYHKLFTSAKDSILNENNFKQLNELSTKYETEKKELAIELQKKEIAVKNGEVKQQSRLKFAFASGFILMALLSVVVYRGYRQKRKANEIISTQKKEVELKNTIVESQRHQLEEKNTEITDSINYARKIQSALLPSEPDFKKLLPDSFILFKPKDIVSGDFYWITEINDKVIYCTADCTGHGVPGGFMSMLGTSFLNEIVIMRQIDSPAEIMNELRKQIIRSLKQTGVAGENKDGMDAVICSVDRKKKQLTYSAANNSCYILRSAELIELKPDKMAIGYGEKLNSFSQNTFELQNGDMIYSFTDGYADQFGGEKGKKFKYSRLAELFKTIGLKNLDEQKLIMTDTITEWQGRLEQVDDILVVGVRI